MTGARLRPLTVRPAPVVVGKARAARRNLAETRNAQIADLGLKRVPSSDLDHGTREVQIADFVLNLRTLDRLVREASAA